MGRRCAASAVAPITVMQGRFDIPIAGLALHGVRL